MKCQNRRLLTCRKFNVNVAVTKSCLEVEDMSESQDQVLLIIEPDIQNSTLIVHTLGEAGIPPALLGANAAAHYGGGLCALVRTTTCLLCRYCPPCTSQLTYKQDIELVINGDDQERAYHLLTSRGFRPSIPEGAAKEPPADYADWRSRAPSYIYRDRRRVRISTPIYDSPLTGDPIDDAMRPFILLFSAETVGLPKVPTITDLEASISTNGSAYIRLERVKGGESL